MLPVYQDSYPSYTQVQQTIDHVNYGCQTFCQKGTHYKVQLGQGNLPWTYL